MPRPARFTTPSSSAPDSPASAPPSSSRRPASTTSSSSSAPTASAAPGATTLSRCGVRHPVAAVLVLVRQEPVVVARLLLRRRDLRPHRGHGRRVRAASAASGSTPRSPGWRSTRRAGVWTVTTKGRKKFQARTVVLASGPLADHKLPDIRGIDTYEGHKIHSARVGPRLRLHRQAGRRHRHRRQRRADRARTGQDRPSSSRSSSAPRAGCCPASTSPMPGGGAVAVRQSACHPRAGPPGAVLGSRGQRDRAGVEHPADRRWSPGWARRTCAARSRIRGCAASSPRTSPRAASGC